jgi:hypothetical protein
LENAVWIVQLLDVVEKPTIYPTLVLQEHGVAAVHPNDQKLVFCKGISPSWTHTFRQGVGSETE